MTDELLRIKIKLAKKKLRDAEMFLGELERTCESLGHTIKKDGTSATCDTCWHDGGWWCPKSKNHMCQYTKSYDSCDFCHQPEERK